MTQKVDKFLQGTAISSPKNRYRVLTARASEMSQRELKATIEAVKNEHRHRYARLIELGAPRVIIENEKRLIENSPTLRLLYKFLVSSR